MYIDHCVEDCGSSLCDFSYSVFWVLTFSFLGYPVFMSKGILGKSLRGYHKVITYVPFHLKWIVYFIIKF